ncbi:MAG: hypothetical protein ACREA0_07650 [bacterium]
MIANPVRTMNKVRFPQPLSPDPTGRLNQLREDDLAAEIAEDAEYQQQLRAGQEEHARQYEEYRRAGGPQVRWYRPTFLYWINPATAAWLPDDGTATELFSQKGYGLVAVQLVPTRGLPEQFLVVRDEYVGHPWVTREWGPRTAPEGSRGAFRWGGAVPKGWTVWHEDLAFQRRVLRLVK